MHKAKRMSRLADAFARARAEKRAAFVAYLCAGDPDFETSLAACRTVIENGVRTCSNWACRSPIRWRMA